MVGETSLCVRAVHSSNESAASDLLRPGIPGRDREPRVVPAELAYGRMDFCDLLPRHDGVRRSVRPLTISGHAATLALSEDPGLRAVLSDLEDARIPGRPADGVGSNDSGEAGRPPELSEPGSCQRPEDLVKSSDTARRLS